MLTPEESSIKMSIWDKQNADYLAKMAEKQRQRDQDEKEGVVKTAPKVCIYVCMYVPALT